MAPDRSERPDLAARRAFFREHILIQTHIPKTAGSSVSAGLSGIVGGIHAMDVRLKRSTPFPEMSPEDVADTYLVSGHFAYGIHDRFGRKPLYFAAVREPVDRAVSAYRYLQNETEQVDHKFVRNRDFEESWFALERHHGVKRRDHQSKMLLGEDPLKPVDRDALWHQVDEVYFLIIPQPRVTEALAALRAAFGVHWARIPRTNPSRGAKVEVSPEMRQKILDANPTDALLYEHIEKDFDFRLQRACDYIASRCLLPLQDGAE